MPRPLSIAPGELRNFILKYADTKTLYQMHKETGVSSVTIADYAEKMGVVLIKDNDSEKAKIDNMILDNPTFAVTQIANLLGVTPGKVQYRARLLGIEIKYVPPKRKKKVIEQNDKLFNVKARENWLV